MIVPDVNLIFFAHNAAAPLHRPARSWWEDLLSREQSVGLPWAVIFGFVRLTTDIHIAALAMEHQCELHSNDRDFERFPGLGWHDPLHAR